MNMIVRNSEVLLMIYVFAEYAYRKWHQIAGNVEISGKVVKLFVLPLWTLPVVHSLMWVGRQVISKSILENVTYLTEMMSLNIITCQSWSPTSALSITDRNHCE